MLIDMFSPTCMLGTIVSIAVIPHYTLFTFAYELRYILDMMGGCVEL